MFCFSYLALSLCADSEEGQWDSATQGGAEEKAGVVTALCTLLATKGDMLREYFQIGFYSDLDTLYLVTMPELLTGHRPQPEALPLFLLRLGVEVDWEEEYNCFEGVSKELALCYCALPSSSAGIIEARTSNVSERERDKEPVEVIGKHTEVIEKMEMEMDEKRAEGSSIGFDAEGNSAQSEVDIAEYQGVPSDLQLSPPASLCPAARTLLLQCLLPALKAYLSPPVSLATDGSFVVIAALEQLYKVFERC